MVALKHLKNWWVLVAALMAVPYVLLFVAGSLWLWEHSLLWEFVGVGGVFMLAGWGLARWLRAKRARPINARVEPALTWPPSGHAAWEQIEAIAVRVEGEDLPLDRPQPMWDVLREVLETVAQHYHPDSKQAVLEIPVPHVLKVAELVAKELREAFSRNVPGAHILTLNDFRRLKEAAAWAQHLYLGYRIASFGVSPGTAILRELRDLAAGRTISASGNEVKRWAVGYCVRKAGYYAIQLYSGQLVLDEVEFRAYQTKQSRKDSTRAQTHEEQLADEPLRMLVLGQAKAGKSSLVNALFGEPRAPVDAASRSKKTQPYKLQREGVPSAIVLDTLGYAPDDDSAALARVREQHHDCDLIFLVCAAPAPARDADRRLLDDVRAFYQANADRVMPPVLVVLSQIDALAPDEPWRPPYNLARPEGAKALEIVQTLFAVASALAVDAAQVIPVCLKFGQVYNVEGRLIPAILAVLPEAQRVKYLRCLRQYHREKKWQRLWDQTVSSGKLLWQASAAWMSGRRSPPPPRKRTPRGGPEDEGAESE